MYETVIKSIMRSASDSIPADWSNVFQDADRRQIIQQKIKEYQNKLESLAAENEELKAQLGITETQSTEETQTAAETENQSQEMVSENQTDQTGAQQAENTDNSGDEMKILVLGDSIWGNYRDDTGVSARLTACLAQKGKMRRSITVPSAAPAQPSARTIMNTSLVLPVTAPWER